MLPASSHLLSSSGKQRPALCSWVNTTWERGQNTKAGWAWPEADGAGRACQGLLQAPPRQAWAEGRTLERSPGVTCVRDSAEAGAAVRPRWLRWTRLVVAACGILSIGGGGGGLAPRAGRTLFRGQTGFRAPGLRRELPPPTSHSCQASGLEARPLSSRCSAQTAAQRVLGLLAPGCSPGAPVTVRTERLRGRRPGELYSF